MKSFCIRHYRTFYALSAFFAITAACLFSTGCAAAAWLTDASSILALVGASFTSITSFIAGLTGDTALAAELETISTWIAKIQTSLADLSTLVAQYQKSASSGLLAEIEAALADVTTNVKQDFSNLGLPTSVLSVITGIAALAGNMLAEWSAAISGVKSAATPKQLKEATARLADIAAALPAAEADFKLSVDAILSTPTGDAKVDMALLKAVRI